MSEKNISGKITFIHHDKDRAVIEYLENGKKKTIQGDVGAPVSTAKKTTQQKKPHRFLVGDQVTFTIKKTGANGRILYATNVAYKYNTALELLINAAEKENKFLGYVKVTDDKYFVKEIESYLFFPLAVSPYEIAPEENETAHPVYFKLEHLDKPDKITASLYNHDYTPEFLSAVQAFKKQTVVEATVYKITPFGIHVNLFNEKIQGKLAADEIQVEKISAKTIGIGTIIPVKIKHLSPTKIVLENAG
jgi:S1 RNA binding domain